MENKTNNGKKKIVVVLLLFAISALVGYGVYSYYWTEGSFSGKGSTIEIAAFDPQTTIDNDSDFLGHGGSLHISCPDSTYGNESMSCSGSVLVSNNGDTAITVEVLDAESGAYDVNVSEGSSFEIDTSTPSFGWTSTTINAGESTTLSITVPFTVSSDYGSDVAVDAGSSAEHDGDAIGISTSFKLKATQVHN